MACENHEDLLRRLEVHDSRLDAVEGTIQNLQIGSAAKDEQIKTVFVILAEIKQMLKDYTTEMKTAMVNFSIELDKLKGRPGRFFDGAVTAAIGAIIGMFVTLFMMFILKVP